MCLKDSAVEVSTILYSFDYIWEQDYPAPALQGNALDSWETHSTFSLTRVSLQSLCTFYPPEVINDDVLAAIPANSFLLISDCCCPCKWQLYISSFPYMTSVGSFTRSVDRSAHVPPLPPLNGVAILDCEAGFSIEFNPDYASQTCGLGSVTYTPQGPYWPTFDGVTPLDPLYFGGDGLEQAFPVSSYSGDAILDPGPIQFGTPVTGIYSLPPGYFFWYEPAIPPATPAPITGASGTGNGFRQPCAKDMNFTQTVSWDRTVPDGGVDVHGSGSGVLTVAFVP